MQEASIAQRLKTHRRTLGGVRATTPQRYFHVTGVFVYPNKRSDIHDFYELPVSYLRVNATRKLTHDLFERSLRKAIATSHNALVAKDDDADANDDTVPLSSLSCIYIHATELTARTFARDSKRCHGRVLWAAPTMDACTLLRELSV